MESKKILLGLTTTIGSDWVKKVEEMNKYNIQEVALFLTGLDRIKRKELYALLEKSPLRSVPHIHLRVDMNKAEIKYLIDRYGVELFNVHPAKEIEHKLKYSDIEDIIDKIYIENVATIPSQKELDACGGLCVDFSHWENRKKKREYTGFEELVKKNKIGCCHISGIKTFLGLFSKDIHLAENEKNFDYIKKYQNYLPNTISLELENSFQEQLLFKKYIEGILNLKCV